jgi:hypothetical protein
MDPAGRPVVYEVSSSISQAARAAKLSPKLYITIQRITNQILCSFLFHVSAIISQNMQESYGIKRNIRFSAFGWLFSIRLIMQSIKIKIYITILFCSN